MPDFISFSLSTILECDLQSLYIDIIIVRNFDKYLSMKVLGIESKIIIALW